MRSMRELLMCKRKMEDCVAGVHQMESNSYADGEKNKTIF